MSSDHESVQEVLGAYVLHALEGEEQERAENFIAGHLPACPECRSLYEELQEVAGELAFAAGARRPPRVLGARLRRDVRSSRARRLASVLMTAAAVVALVALGLWTAHLTNRVSQADSRQARTGDFLATVSHPQSHVVPLADSRPSTGVGEVLPVQLAAAYVPGRGSVYLFGSMPAPHTDRIYQLWVLRGGRFQSAGTFRPEKGQVLMQIRADPEQIEGLLVTEEPREGSERPSDQRVLTATF
jgi:Anti-sigma-K factor rskA